MQQSDPKATIMDANAMHRAIVRIAHEILEHNHGATSVALVGVLRRGVPLSQALADEIAKIEGVRPEIGSLDISFYRDDIHKSDTPVIHHSDIPFSVEDKNIVLVDDVLYTGRTVRAALDALIDLGRPATIQLVVMVDRGHRELPIRADYVGKNVPSSRDEDIQVHVGALDGYDAVEIWNASSSQH